MRAIFTYFFFTLLQVSKQIADEILFISKINYDDITAFGIIFIACIVFYRKMNQKEKQIISTYNIMIDKYESIIKSQQEQIEKLNQRLYETESSKN